MMFPSTKLVKFRVVESIAQASGAGAIQTFQFKLNSLNDPTGVLSASLPLGLDQWAAMYQRYVVVGTKVYLKAHAESVTGSIVYGLNIMQDSSALSNYKHYMEMPRTRSKLLSSDVDHSGLGVGWSLKKNEKVRKVKDAEDYHADFSTTPGDPTEIRYAHLWFQDVNSTSAATLEGVLTLEYVVLLFDPVSPARSSL